MIEVNGGTLGQGEGGEALGDGALGRRPGTSAGAKWGWEGAEGEDPPSSSEGSACMFASAPARRGEEGLYCSHVLAR